VIPVAESLSSGDLPIAEITLRTDAALASTRNITRALPHILVGAGTMIQLEKAQAACAAGAKFLVSSGLDEELIFLAQQKNIPIRTTPCA
jgi:2-dehydro-3-deoxyphosphogluconate aldolase / (4S)-4-hydroxy-2-oxoglutarate aldolase